MKISTAPETEGPGWAINVSLTVSEVLVLADLLRYQAALSEKNSAPGHARIALELADGIIDAHTKLKERKSV